MVCRNEGGDVCEATTFEELREGERVRALPGIESQGISRRVVGKLGTIQNGARGFGWNVRFDGERYSCHTNERYLERVEDDGGASDGGGGGDATTPFSSAAPTPLEAVTEASRRRRGRGVRLRPSPSEGAVDGDVSADFSY